VLAPGRLGFDDEVLRLAVALYDALYLTHPRARRQREAGRARVAEFAESCAALGPPRDAGVALARHTVLHNLFRLARTERGVSFWAGAREFRGQDPPARLLRWPRLRRVRIDVERLNWYQAGVSSPVRAVVR